MTEKPRTIGDANIYSLATNPGNARVVDMGSLMGQFIKTCGDQGVQVRVGHHDGKQGVALITVLSKGVEPEAFREIMTEVSRKMGAPLWVASMNDERGQQRFRQANAAAKIKRAAFLSSEP